MNNFISKYAIFPRDWFVALRRFLGTLIFVVASLCLTFSMAFGQDVTSISGKVTDYKTGEALPYVNVFFKGSATGTVTDDQGKYTLETSEMYDSLVASFIGYTTQLMPVKYGTKQIIDFDLKESSFNLNEVVVMSGENPAWAIIRKVIENKKKNDKNSLQAYDYKSYNKIELDINQISKNLQKRKIMTKVEQAVDSASMPRDDRGVPVLPIFFSESVSRYFVKNNPPAHRENVEKTKISGIAMENGSLTAQVVGASYQEYNFYENWLNILDKDFVSPLADGWRIYYDFEIMDTVKVDGLECFELKVIPNRDKDPAFNGTIWITTDDYAVKQVDLKVDNSANLNFVKKIWIKQDLGKTQSGPWLPKTTNVEIDVGQIVPGTAGFRARFYNSTSDWIVDKPQPDKYYEQQVMLSEDANNTDEAFWASPRRATFPRRTEGDARN